MNEIQLECRGRYKPIASIQVTADGAATVRVDFAGDDSLWLEADLTDESLAVVASLKTDATCQPGK